MNICPPIIITAAPWVPTLVSTRTKEVLYADRQTREPPLATVTNNLLRRQDQVHIQHIQDPKCKRYKQEQVRVQLERIRRPSEPTSRSLRIACILYQVRGHPPPTLTPTSSQSTKNSNTMRLTMILGPLTWQWSTSLCGNW